MDQLVDDIFHAFGVAMSMIAIAVGVGLAIQGNIIGLGFCLGLVGGYCKLKNQGKLWYDLQTKYIVMRTFNNIYHARSQNENHIRRTTIFIIINRDIIFFICSLL